MGRTKQRRRYRRFNWQIFLMAMAGVVFLLIFNYIPMFGIAIALKDLDYSMNIMKDLAAKPWVGLTNFVKFVTDPQFGSVMSNTLILSISELVITFPIPIIFALLLNELRSSKFRKVVQTITYFPHFISWIIVYGLFFNLFSSSGKPMQEMEHVILQTVNACRTMSENRTGALIVFAREQKLDEYIRHGVLIDGHVTEQLLRTIFFLNTDLHDKAVIIQDGRLAAARCKLPEAIAPLPAVLSELGTRHNSAVGMSQASDALVVVVSEQTGTISVAMGGMLKRQLTPETLEKLLRNELCHQQESEQNSSPVKVLRKITGQEKERSSHGKK